MQEIRNASPLFNTESTIRLDPIANGVIRVRLDKTESFKQNIMERYGVVDAAPDAEGCYSASDQSLTAGDLTLCLDEANHMLLMNAADISTKITLFGWGEDMTLWRDRADWLRERLDHWCDTQRMDHPDEDQDRRLLSAGGNVSAGPAFGAAFTITENDAIYGFGEAANGSLLFNGKTILNRVLYQVNEIPIPLAISSRGWGIFYNTAAWHGVDIGARERDILYFCGDFGETDFFVLYGGSILGVIQKYTRLTGQPVVLPKWMYGLSYINHYNARDFDVLNDAREFRSEGIPCDMFSLEPGWMAKDYDFGARKDWNTQKFYVCDWMRRPFGKESYPGTFIGALKRMGIKLSLWLCCNYDLTAEEERRAGNEKDFGIEPWFRHLHKFIDDGVAGFKMDPAHLTDNSGPDKIYANGMSDPEIHNLLQTVYSKQMHLGFYEYTGLRPMHHYCGGYTGIQRWGAATTGDSGGGAKSMNWVLSLGLAGNANVSCDMDIFDKPGLHYAMFTAWPVLDSWSGFFQPWYAGEETRSMFRDYAKLRYRIVPYTYSSALEAFLTSMPIVRAMPLIFPGENELRDICTQYFYGPSMLITAFTDNVYLPEGKWWDMWRGEEVAGGGWLSLNLPDNRGGGFFLRSSSIVPLWNARPYIDDRDEEDLTLLVYCHDRSEYIFYEDDGLTNAYRCGGIAKTVITCEEKDETVQITIGERQGAFVGMGQRRSWHVIIAGPKPPAAVYINGGQIPYEWNKSIL